MTIRTVDLSGRYEIQSVTGTRIDFVTPELLNPNWFHADLDGAGTTGYAQNITMILSRSDQPVNLAGQYEVASVTPTEVTLVDPHLVNTDWNVLSGYAGAETSPLSAFATRVTPTTWIGPFTIDMSDLTAVVCNFVAPQGLYKDDGDRQVAFPIDIQIELTPIDDDDVPTGPAELFNDTIVGNSKGRDQRALTVVCAPSFTGRCRVRARRVTDTDYTFKGSVVDEIKWVDCYGLAPTGLPDFGDVTTVHIRNYATEGALAVRERKINMLVTRKLPARVDGEFTVDLFPTDNAADIISAIALDPRIGGRSEAEVDFDNIYDTVAEVVEYFGTEEAAKFQYTFDKVETSFEETLATVADAVFCSAYRRGSQIMIYFERENADSSLLFNHRNKLPKTETRTVRFGNFQDNDGVTYRYVSPDDDSVVELKLPIDGSSLSPKVVDSIGVRSHEQAHFQAWRIWNKMRYQNITVEFQATQEADLLVRNERILVADNTRPDTIDGEIVSQNVLQVELSQPFLPAGPIDHTIFIQHYDGTVESLPIVSVDGVDPHLIVLGSAPRLPLAVGDDLYRNATYEIVGNTSPRSSAFLVQDRHPQSNFTSTVTAINYDSRYYDNDSDFIDGLI